MIIEFSKLQTRGGTDPRFDISIILSPECRRCRGCNETAGARLPGLGCRLPLVG